MRPAEWECCLRAMEERSLKVIVRRRSRIEQIKDQRSSRRSFSRGRRLGYGEMKLTSTCHTRVAVCRRVVEGTIVYLATFDVHHQDVIDELYAFNSAPIIAMDQRGTHHIHAVSCVFRPSVSRDASVLWLKLRSSLQYVLYVACMIMHGFFRRRHLSPFSKRPTTSPSRMDGRR
nr:hypothetical protein CFP56_63781 [Quercus suber]